MAISCGMAQYGMQSDELNTATSFSFSIETPQDYITEFPL